MTPEQVQSWLSDMRAAGRARSDADCARQLGMTYIAMSRIKHNGLATVGKRRLALACNALLHGLSPYDATEPRDEHNPSSPAP